MHAKQILFTLLSVVVVFVVLMGTTTTTATTTATSSATDGRRSSSDRPQSSSQLATESSHQLNQEPAAAAAAAAGRSLKTRSLIDRTVYTSNSAAAGFVFADRTDLRLNLADPIDVSLSKILDRNGPDMRPSRDFKDFSDITMNVSKRAWSLLHEHAQIHLKDRLDLARPAIDELLRAANVSERCHRAIGETFEGAKRMDSWAVKLLNSWGNFPTVGLFEGTYSEVGSFHTCVNIKRNPYIDHAHYCSLTFRPVMPSRKNYELVVRKEPQELLNLFERNSTISPPVVEPIGGGGLHNEQQQQQANETQEELDSNRDAFSAILEHAQYHHYVYYKVGTCWPIQCSPFDVRRVAKLAARRTILMNGPVKCYSLDERDYEEAGSVESAADGGGGGGGGESSGYNNNINSNASASVEKTKRKLVISIWDLNDGIFIWKPHFYTAHKIALAILVAVTVFILSMTLIDLLANRIPQLFGQYKLATSCQYTMAANHQAGNADVQDGDDHGDDDDAVDEDGDGDEVDETRANDAAMAGTQLQLDHSNGAMSMAITSCCGGGGGGADRIEVLSSGAAGGHDMARQQVCRVVSSANKAAGGKQSSLCYHHQRKSPHRELSLWMTIVDDCSIISNASQFFSISEAQLKQISCLDGIRCITMVWIIMTHTMMYNDWSAFARTREVEKSVKSPIGQPLFNGSYLVDTFFLLSGLLSAYTAFRHCQGLASKFSALAFITNRWLRLTPQIFFVSMIYIVLPAVSYGPHWFPIVGEYSENCVDNWWINVLHAQAFHKTEKMCNFVTWWISIDFLYHFYAVAVIWIILYAGHKLGLLTIVGILISQVGWQAAKHYRLSLPPNILSTIPQTGAMWTEMTLNFFWTPYSHSVPFFFGFYLGYLMALKRKLIQRQLNARRAVLGWLLAASLLLSQSYSTYWWISGDYDYPRLISTIFHVICPIIWAGALSWTILACQHGHGAGINEFLSSRVFIILGKASYMVYLSHFQVLFIYFGNQSLLLEPTPVVMFYMILGNIIISTIYGCFLCIVYELPWLRTQKKLMKYLSS